MILDTLKLDGKVAIITGAGRGLGRAMAIKFAEAGADVVAASRTQKQLEETAAEVSKTGRKCIIVPTDVTNSQQVNALAEATIKEFGRIDILINNAGGGDNSLGKRLEEITDAEWRRGLDTNLTSQFYGCRAVIPQMVKQGRGKIINIASGYGLRGGKHNYMYACSKGGTIQLTRSMALTYAQHDIQTNCIVPGIFPHNEEMMRFFKGGKFIPIGRVGEDAELGPLAIFLASDASNHVNGELIAIDGGGLAGGITPTGVAPQTVA
ncbi:MAG: SDR family NAD(P)-dependent oxidoreductase [Candidatus Binatus sp.]|uniref:SDR family NAD(P)-dependent oxidoreductase n=1 Tax=Candidatus Binatus sp. TaxID=2811406 RepID=UPI00271CA400|nr:SDR family NAD(P)-dependent oxidoreductase [Candidatus Binatus sp.]MDO8431361.1 SDR family NAD(P)-dependent oxidoreductase [Candidatus Binatus sp.]